MQTGTVAPACLEVREELKGSGSQASFHQRRTGEGLCRSTRHSTKPATSLSGAFNRLKDWRAIATRYDKTASNFLAGVCLVAAVIYWLH